MKIISAETTNPGTVKIFLNDEDVTSTCFYAEGPDQPSLEADGMVMLFISGNIKTKTGKVRWEPILQ